MVGLLHLKCLAVAKFTSHVEKYCSISESIEPRMPWNILVSQEDLPVTVRDRERHYKYLLEFMRKETGEEDIDVGNLLESEPPGCSKSCLCHSVSCLHGAHLHLPEQGPTHLPQAYPRWGHSVHLGAMWRVSAQAAGRCQDAHPDEELQVGSSDHVGVHHK